MTDNVFEFLLSEANQHFSGWDFSYISDTGRTATAPLPWSYASQVLSRLRNAESLLDMGTGGGEFLSMLHPLPAYTYATEGYAPNISIAKERLEPLGIQVYPVEDDSRLPFEANTFDLIINRHESYDPAEIRRICKPGGTFITQQVGAKNNLDLNEMLGASTAIDWDDGSLPEIAARLKQAGWHIIKQQEAFPLSRFYDVGAIVYQLKAVSWQIPDFSVETYFEPLKQIHQQIQKAGFVDITDHRLLIIAQKMA